MNAAAHAIAPQVFDGQRQEAAHLAMSALHVYERANPHDLRPRMAATAALDFGTGLLSIYTDANTLEQCRQWADAAARGTDHPQARAAALAVAATCERTVSLSAVQRLVSAALE